MSSNCKAGLSYLFHNGHFETRKEKIKRQGRKPIGNNIAAGKFGFPTKPNSGTESLVGCSARVVETSNDLTRSRPCYEGSKSEICGVGGGIGDRRAAVEG
ncbi:hypothetical protein AVEN_115676-1 [Araneus ventricosus]|uniref:Uncharacterized protein n=1 Tax=Araneus ventricosus TaxID=182803 RepID=A0A4Y2I5Q0_ARAVE|nr:hypothetical protein AVEN_115676-1 [Araneus ventricosus]